MAAVPATTPYMGLPRFDASDSSSIWVHLNKLADQVDQMYGPWQTYEPVWSQSSGTVLNVGSGSLTGRYIKIGRVVHAHIRLERAADSNIGSGLWVWTLPPVQPRSWNMIGGGFSMARDGNWFGGGVFPVSQTSVGAIVGDLGRVSNTVPLGDTRHAAGDWYSLQITYEAAN